MRRLARGLSTVILLPLLIAAAAYGFYWFQVKSYLDKLVDELSPFAQLSYGSIYANPLGEVGADGLVLVLNQDGSRIPIQSVRVRSKDPLFFLDPQARVDAGDWPDALSLAIRGVDFDLSSPLFRELEAQAEQALEPGMISPDALGCGSVERFDLPALRKMGYGRLPMDLTLGLRLDRPNRLITLESGADIDGMGNSLMQFEISVTTDNLAPAQMMAANPRLRHIEMSYQDSGYNLRRNSFCAKEAGVEVALYRQRHEALLQQWLADLGVHLPASLWSLYQGASQPRANLLFTMDPPGGLGAEVLTGSGSPQYLFERLNIGAKLNGKRVALDDVNLEQMFSGQALQRALEDVEATTEEIVPEALVEVPEPLPPALESADDELLRGMPKRKAETAAKSYKPTRLADLNAMVGRPVRIYTDLGNRMEGKLVAANGSRLRVESRVDKGLVQYPLDYAQVRRVEVYR